jgi:hypothetical protein
VSLTYGQVRLDPLRSVPSSVPNSGAGDGCVAAPGAALFALTLVQLTLDEDRYTVRRVVWSIEEAPRLR